MDSAAPVNPTYSVVTIVASMLPEQYRSLIYSKWMHSLRHGNDYFKLVDSDAFYKSYERYIKILFAKPSSFSKSAVSVRLAVLTDDPDVVLGFAVVDGSALHYVHVHKDQRRQGIGRALVPERIQTITHLTKTGLTIWAEKMPGVKFNPFI